jgi:hypothetical protein
MRRSICALLASLALVEVWACSSEEKAPVNQPPPTAPPGDTVSKSISAAAGGRIDLPDGTSLEIPPGALAEDATITITTPKNQTDAGGFLIYQLGPSGTTFSKPVTLTVPYTDRPQGDPLISAWEYSTVTPLVDLGSEKTRWQDLAPSARDMENNRVSFELQHFSFVLLAVAVPKYAHIVKDIPPEYLLPGDILFALTTLSGKPGPDFNPGHVGMFVGGRDPCTDAISDRVIEATPPRVASSKLATFKTAFGHQYLGARRPGGGLTYGDRAGIVTYLERQIGKDYGSAVPGTDIQIPVGEGNIDELAFSCVGLAEAALDSIDKGVIPALNEAFASVPLELWATTVPVSDITVEVGDQVDIPVVGLVLHPSSPWALTTVRGWYCRGKQPCCTRGSYCNDYEIAASIAPQVGTFQREGDGYHHFRWTPLASDVGRKIFITFTLTANPVATPPTGDPFYVGPVTETETLLIEVRPCDLDAGIDTGVHLPDGGPDSSVVLPRFSVNPVAATFTQETFSTEYLLGIENPNAEPISVEWSGPNCGTFAPMGAGAANTMTTQVWSMVWTHPHPPCDDTTDHSDQTITATVRGTSGTFSCSYPGAHTGVGPACTPR